MTWKETAGWDISVDVMKFEKGDNILVDLIWILIHRKDLHVILN